MDSSDSYNGDDAPCFLWEWRASKDHYFEATRENGQLDIHLGASQAALLAVEKEANAARAWLAESDAMVAGKMNSKNAFIPISIVLYIDNSPVSVIASLDGAVGVPSTGGERSRGCHQRPGLPHQRLSS